MSVMVIGFLIGFAAGAAFITLAVIGAMVWPG
jgi:hypothetical protein